MATLANQIKERLARQIGYADWLARYVAIEYISDDGEARFCCVAHAEEQSSCHFNVHSGLWKCQSANCGEAGDAIDLYYWVRGLKKKSEAIRLLALELGLIHEISEKEVACYHERLMNSEALLARAQEMFHLGRATLSHFQIGYVSRGENEPGRFTIPIQGEGGAWEDIRLYNRQAERKIIHWASGHGAPRLFPIQHLAQDTLFFFAGEKDTMRAWENGVEGAITVTGAEGVLPDDFSRLFRGKTVTVCFDVDDAGRKAAVKVARRLAAVARNVFILTLPREGLPENGDYTDWCSAGHTAEEWAALVEQAIRVEPVAGHLYEPEQEDTEAREVTFRDLQAGDLYGKHIRFLAHAMGKSHGLASYQVPTELLIDCPRSQGKMCSKCALYMMDPKAKPWTVPVTYRSEKSLSLFRVNEEAQNAAIRKTLGIQRRCEVVTISSVKRQSIQHLLLSPAVELAQMREDYNGLVTAYYHGEPISDNKDYWFSGYLQADPKTQQGVLNLHAATPARNAIENFTVNEEVFEALEWFKPRPGQTIAEHFHRLHEIIEEDTGIWGQHGLQQAVLETIYSVLEFNCGSHPVENGWIETLVIGDTGTGKSTCSRRIMQMVNVGELISGETVSAAGLIGGIEFIDRIPITKWGALPRNHGGFVVLDEIDALQTKDKDIISQLTALRSSGMAEITKIHNAKTPTKVRLLWLTNPQEGRAIASFNGACRAIEGVISSRQDVARFTKVYAVASDSVDVKTITQKRERSQKPAVRRHFNNLAILTWSLLADQVQFTGDAQELLRQQTEVLTRKYHEAIPLLEKGRAFDKLAKLSIPVAVLCGSFQTSGEKLVLLVDTGHAAYAIQHLQQVYDGKDMGYQAFSAVERERETIPDESQVIRAIDQVVSVPRLALLRYLLTHNMHTRQGVEEFIGERLFAHSLWSALLAQNCLAHGQRLDTAVKTQAFAGLLERLITQERSGAVKFETQKRAPISR